jgi:hypothetical protein
MTRIGVCTPAKQGVVVMSGAGKPIAARTEGYDHFAKV